MDPWIAFALILGLATLFVAPYVLYGLMLRLIKPTGKAGGNVGPFMEIAPEDDDRPLVSLLIPAHNEAEHLRGKLNNTLNLAYPPDRLEIIVCSDGSTDGTDEIAKKFERHGVTLVRNAERSGKATALKTLFDASRGGLLVFTDASATLATDTVARLVHAATDPQVGVAAARYVVGGEQAAPEAGYWGMEAKLRRSEAEREMLLGASGACYLIRRELFTTPPPDTINDDYIIPMLARERGFKVAYVHEATAGDAPTDSSETLYYRWVRIAYGNYQMLWRHRRLLWPGTPRIAVPLWRKFLRTIGPWLLVAALIITGFAALTEPIFATVLTLSGVGLALGIISLLLRDTPVGELLPFRILRYGLLAQSAYLHGAGRFIFQRNKNLWKRPEVDSLDLSKPVPPPRAIRITKRVMDIIMATIGLIVFSPVLLITAIAVKLDSRGPIFYMQERERPGPDGTPNTFRMFKFRSMIQDAEKTTGPVWASQGGKARVTRVGACIRKYRIDEIPQFINVLKGDMSVIGPRPERPFFTRQFEEEIPGYADRISVVRPGITGWAQVQCPPDSTTDTVRFKVKHDLAYIASLYRFLPFIRMEIRILWRTVGVMLRGTKDS